MKIRNLEISRKLLEFGRRALVGGVAAYLLFSLSGCGKRNVEDPSINDGITIMGELNDDYVRALSQYRKNPVNDEIKKGLVKASKKIPKIAAEILSEAIGVEVEFKVTPPDDCFPENVAIVSKANNEEICNTSSSLKKILLEVVDPLYWRGDGTSERWTDDVFARFIRDSNEAYWALRELTDSNLSMVNNKLNIISTESSTTSPKNEKSTVEESTTKKPESTTKKPESTTKKSESTTKKSESTTKIPKTASAKGQNKGKYTWSDLSTGISKDKYVRGIDISNWQHKMDLAKVLANNDIDFVMLRAANFNNSTYNKLKEKYFDILKNDYDIEKANKIIDEIIESTAVDKSLFRFSKICEEKNIPFGLYFLPQLENSAEAELELKVMNKVLQKIYKQGTKRLRMPLCLDVENIDGNKPVDRVARGESGAIKALDKIVSTFEAQKFYVGLYASRNNYLAMKRGLEAAGVDLALWIARYLNEDMRQGYHSEPNVAQLPGIESLCIKQYSSTAKLKGYSGYVDANICFVNFPKIIENKDLNDLANSNGKTKVKEKGLN